MGLSGMVGLRSGPVLRSGENAFPKVPAGSEADEVVTDDCGLIRALGQVVWFFKARVGPGR